ncbi:unnamed protein product [Thelazia callipaeda]|uniref:Leucine-rich repeat extensin-like protein 3 n=1 Tax=Thelazia callipaeda TaxID=103827 RepID=A0A0N5CVZ3_THECL|nr:unnamed protein product [Thelazia callipaeda]
MGDAYEVIGPTIPYAPPPPSPTSPELIQSPYQQISFPPPPPLVPMFALPMKDTPPQHAALQTDSKLSRSEQGNYLMLMQISALQ